MRTLAQIRAGNALRSLGQQMRGQQGGDAVKKFPMLVKTDGLLAALAFAAEKGGGHAEVARAVAQHLASEGVNISDAIEPAELTDELAGADARALRRATAESLAFLSYLKRFAA